MAVRVAFMIYIRRAGRVPLATGLPLQALKGFVVLGVEHILSGHLSSCLFCWRRYYSFSEDFRGLNPGDYRFHSGHSVTLLGSAFNLAPRGAWFPPLSRRRLRRRFFTGAGEYCGRQSPSSVDYCGTVRAGPRFRVSYALKDQLAICWLTSARVAVFFQRGNRDRATGCAVRGGSGAGTDIPRGARGTDGRGSAVSGGGAHRMALDDRPVECALADAMAPTYRAGYHDIRSLGCRLAVGRWAGYLGW